MQLHTNDKNITPGLLWGAALRWLVDGQIPAEKPVVYARMTLPDNVFDAVTAHRGVVPILTPSGENQYWEAIPGMLTIHRNGDPCQENILIGLFYDEDLGKDGAAYDVPAELIFAEWVKAIGGTMVPLHTTLN